MSLSDVGWVEGRNPTEPSSGSVSLPRDLIGSETLPLPIYKNEMLRASSMPRGFLGVLFCCFYKFLLGCLTLFCPMGFWDYLYYRFLGREKPTQAPMGVRVIVDFEVVLVILVLFDNHPYSLAGETILRLFEYLLFRLVCRSLKSV